MSKVSYPSTSPYAITPQTTWFIKNYVPRPILPAKDDSNYVLQTRHQYRPVILSQELHGTPGYWWVFMVRNLNIIRDPTFDFVAGLNIIVPSAAYIKKILG